MASIDQNLRSRPGVEKERRCGIPQVATKRPRKTDMAHGLVAEL
jgi:hypothetical protein